MLNPGQYAKPMLFELGSVLAHFLAHDARNATPCAFLLKWLLLFWFINNIRTSLKLLIKLTAAGVHWPNFNQHGTCTALLFDTDSNILIQVSLKLKLHGVPVSVIQSLLQDYVNEMPYFVFFFYLFYISKYFVSSSCFIQLRCQCCPGLLNWRCWMWYLLLRHFSPSPSTKKHKSAWSLTSWGSLLRRAERWMVVLHQVIRRVSKHSPSPS